MEFYFHCPNFSLFKSQARNNLTADEMFLRNAQLNAKNDSDISDCKAEEGQEGNSQMPASEIHSNVPRQTPELAVDAYPLGTIVGSTACLRH